MTTDWRILEKKDYFMSGYNQTWQNERCVELELGFRWLDLNKGEKIMEVGAVMPYYAEGGYYEISHEVIDPYDEKATIVDFMENIDLAGHKVIAISTLEHIGTTDYDGSGERQNLVDADAAPLALQQILNQADSCFVTVPVGYNSGLDNWLEDNLHRLKCFGYLKTQHGFDLSGETWPPALNYLWEYEPEVKSIKGHKYREPFPYGNYVLCIEGWK